MSEKTYGISLHALAKEEGLEEEILSELSTMSELFKKHPDYVKILDSPQIDRGELMTILNDDFVGRMHRYTLNFLKLLSEKHMVHHLHDCLKEYEHLYNRENNLHIVDVTTANEMSVSLIERLTCKLEEKTGGKVILKRHVDKSVLGGIIIETEDRQLDASLRAELGKMKKALTE